MTLIGITGTNGKTTTSYIIKKILETSGEKVGLIGTIKYMIGGREYAASFTTPEAVEYQRLLREMADEGCAFVVSEVSSHALALKRVDHTRFVRAVFTNLTRDHLDYHGTMEQYLDAKKRLFTDLLEPSGVAILNADDPASAEILRDLRCRHMSYGIHSGSDVRASDIVQEPGGMSFRLAWRDKKYDIRTRLLGIPNVYNLLAAAATALSLEMPVEFVVKVLPDMAPVHGRFESIMSGDGVLFIVDYAHTPDALQKLLETVRGIPHRNIITVFGCGGNRDRGKRPLMGQIASEMSDFVVITSDNPRYEDPAAIIEDITEGIRGGNFVSVVERERGVREAVRRAGQGDVVVVAGKGHESYQDIGGVRYPMDDRQLIESALREAGRN
jgi:UDP-N-acetylmuramoyl-L-alanyl-D-glutamate--2,6-diaminopimelate ligase